MAHDPYAALRVKNYRWFIVSLLTMTISSQIQGVVVAWQIYDITHDPLSLGLMGLAEALPFIGFVALRRPRRRLVRTGSAIVDRVARRAARLLAGAARVQSHSAVSARARRVAVLRRDLRERHRAQLSCSRRATRSAPRSSTASLYANAVAWRSSTWQIGRGGRPGARRIDLRLRVAARRVRRRRDHDGVGARHVLRRSTTSRAARSRATNRSARACGRVCDSCFANRCCSSALTLDLFSVLLGGAEALLPGLRRSDSARRAAGTRHSCARRRPRARWSRRCISRIGRRSSAPAARCSIAVATFALCIVGFGLSRSFVLSAALLAISGMADNVSVLIRSTLLQVLTPTHLLGRVSSVNSIFVGSSNELGAFESGVAARLLGHGAVGGARRLGVARRRRRNRGWRSRGSGGWARIDDSGSQQSRWAMEPRADGRGGTDNGP